MKKGVFTSRVTMRRKLKDSQVTFSTFLTFIPIALGFSHFLFHHLSSSKNNSFFQHNLPGLQNLEPNLTVETSKYLAQSDAVLTQNLGSLTKEKGQSEIQNFSGQSPFLFGQPKFLAQLKKSSGEKRILPLFYETKQRLLSVKESDVFVLPSGNFVSKAPFLEALTRNLDELPAYVEGLNQKSSFQEPLEFLGCKERGSQIKLKSAGSKNKFFAQSYEINTKNNLLLNCSRLFSKSFQFQDKINFSSFSKFQPVLQAPSENKQSFGDRKTSSFTRTTFSKNRLDFYTKANQLDTELQNIFLEQGISSFSPVFGEKESTTKRSEDTVFSEMVLQNLENKRLGAEGNPVRSMSGYLYPDTKTSDLYWFSVFRNKKPSFRSPSPALTPLSLTQKYSFHLKGFPQFLIQTKNFVFKDGQQEIYTGPSVVLDFQKNCDWKTSDGDNLRSWFHTYLSPANSLVQSHDNFFGNYSSPQFKAFQKATEVSDFSTHSFLHLKLARTPKTKWKRYNWVYESDSLPSIFAPIQSSVHIPSALLPSQKLRVFGKEGEGESILFHHRPLKEQNVRGLILNLRKKGGEHFFPLLQLRQPLSPSESYSSLFNFGVKGNPDSHFSSSASPYHNLTDLAPGQSRKLPSVFAKKKRSTSLFVSNWEPLTLSSWLLISKISFAIFVFHILKNLSDSYGQELLGYLLDLVYSSGVLNESIKEQLKILLGQRNKGFRIVLQSRKSFSDIVGIQKLLLEIYEVVLFLRNSARSWFLSQTLPYGILLIGPPGTGKTLLVRAIAGEAQVPVIVLSGSSLIQPGESGALKLQLAFQEARNLAPCILFIDEIDNCAAKRSRIMQNPMATDEGFESFLESLILESRVGLEKTEAELTLPFFPSELEELETTKKEQQEKTVSLPNSNHRTIQLSLLSQLLIEVDGIHRRDGVVVIGATNRPEVIDAALLRPGRFEKVIQVGLPDLQKRLEIVKFYGQRVGFSKTLPWQYFGERTAGFTAADLATILNESAIKAIFNQTTHTIETLEHGIDRLTTSENEKYTIFKTRSEKNESLSNGMNSEKVLKLSSKMFILRLAYYTAGKLLLTYALETHPKTVVASLWPRRPTDRSVEITTHLQSTLFEFARVCEIQDRLVGCYAGKAAEFLFLQKFSSKALFLNTDLGSDDLVFGQKLILFMLEKCGFSSKKHQIQETIKLEMNLNMREFRRNPEKLEFYEEMLEDLLEPPILKTLQEEDPNYVDPKDEKLVLPLEEQEHYSLPWWRQEVSDLFEFEVKNPAKATRLYLFDSYRNYRNVEWLPPDEFYHSVTGLKSAKTAYANIIRARKKKQDQASSSPPKNTSPVKKSLDSQTDTPRNSKKIGLPWNELPKLPRDYASHSLVLTSFNKALVLLNENRELLDRLVVELIYHEVLRKPDIEALIKGFPLQRKERQKEEPTEKTVTIVESSWGPQSRKPFPRWIDFSALNQETTEKP